MGRKLGPCTDPEKLTALLDHVGQTVGGGQVLVQVPLIRLPQGLLPVHHPTHTHTLLLHTTTQIHTTRAHTHRRTHLPHLPTHTDTPTTHTNGNPQTPSTTAHLGEELSLRRSVLRWKSEGARHTARLVGVIWFSATAAVTSLSRHRRVCSASRLSSGRSSTADLAACKRSSLGMSVWRGGGRKNEKNLISFSIDGLDYARLNR